MDEVQKHNSFNTNTPSSESYKNYILLFGLNLYFKIQAQGPCVEG
jgi:hypothetical protein